MIFTDYIKGERISPNSKYRYDITSSTEGYDYLELILKNQRGFNSDGFSFNCIQRPKGWKGAKADFAITKGSHNITTLKRPDPLVHYSIGDINGTNDGCIVVFNPDFLESGIKTIEIYIARGLKNHPVSLWQLLIAGELDFDLEAIKGKSVSKIVTQD